VGNVMVMMTAESVAELVMVTLETVCNFAGMEHQNQWVGGVHYYNNSTGSSSARTVATLHASWAACTTTIILSALAPPVPSPRCTRRGRRVADRRREVPLDEIYSLLIGKRPANPGCSALSTEFPAYCLLR